MSKANEIQIGGDHYKKGGEEHWDRVWRLYGRGYFVGCITKYVERYHEKNGIQDLEKASHFIQKVIELEQAEVDKQAASQKQAVLPLEVGDNTDPVKTFHVGEVAPTGWTQFVFEGGDMRGALFTCRSCRAKFYAPFDQNPHDYHGCHDVATECEQAWLDWRRNGVEGDATPAYVYQE